MLPKAQVASPALPAAPQAPNLENAASGQGAAMPKGITFLDEGYQAQASTTHDRGKWYFETWIDAGHIAALGDVLLTTGFEALGPNRSGVVHMTNIRHSHPDSPPVAMGWAIDLDNGAVYARINGRWDRQPGTIGGLELKLNRPYAAYLQGSSSIEELVKRGLIKINLGDQPFEYALPDGYRPFAEAGMTKLP